MSAVHRGRVVQGWDNTGLILAQYLHNTGANVPLHKDKQLSLKTVQRYMCTCQRNLYPRAI